MSLEKKNYLIDLAWLLRENIQLKNLTREEDASVWNGDNLSPKNQNNNNNRNPQKPESAIIATREMA